MKKAIRWGLVCPKNYYSKLPQFLLEEMDTIPFWARVYRVEDLDQKLFKQLEKEVDYVSFTSPFKEKAANFINMERSINFASRVNKKWRGDNLDYYAFSATLEALNLTRFNFKVLGNGTVAERLRENEDKENWAITINCTPVRLPNAFNLAYDKETPENDFSLVMLRNLAKIIKKKMER